MAKYRPHVLAMAAELVQALLQQLVCHGLYTQQELSPGIAAATCGIQELPACVVSLLTIFPGCGSFLLCKPHRDGSHGL